MRHVKGAIGYYVSSYLKNEIEDAGCTGIEFEPVEEGVDAGPWSAFLVFLAYWLGVVFSFGSKSLATKLAFVFMIILGPLKIFDFLFSRLPGADTVAAQLYFIGRKK